MTTLVADHDLWAPGGTVVSLPPSRDDMFAIVLVMGRVALCEPVNEFGRLVQVAERFVRRVRVARPITVKVLSLSWHEACTMLGLDPNAVTAGTPQDEAEWRRNAHEVCIAALRDSTDPVTRADALDLLKRMGALT